MDTEAQNQGTYSAIDCTTLGDHPASELQHRTLKIRPTSAGRKQNERNGGSDPQTDEAEEERRKKGGRKEDCRWRLYAVELELEAVSPHGSRVMTGATPPATSRDFSGDSAMMR